MKHANFSESLNFIIWNLHVLQNWGRKTCVVEFFESPNFVSCKFLTSLTSFYPHPFVVCVRLGFLIILVWFLGSYVEQIAPHPPASESRMGKCNHLWDSCLLSRRTIFNSLTCHKTILIDLLYTHHYWSMRCFRSQSITLIQFNSWGMVNFFGKDVFFYVRQLEVLIM